MKSMRDRQILFTGPLSLAVMKAISASALTVYGRYPGPRRSSLLIGQALNATPAILKHLHPFRVCVRSGLIDSPQVPAMATPIDAPSIASSKHCWNSRATSRPFRARALLVFQPLECQWSHQLSTLFDHCLSCNPKIATQNALSAYVCESVTVAVSQAWLMAKFLVRSSGPNGTHTIVIRRDFVLELCDCGGWSVRMMYVGNTSIPLLTFFSGDIRARTGVYLL
jgi:hypothetical protein